MSDFLTLLNEARDRLRIPQLWAMLNLPGFPPRNGTGVCRSPFRPDNKPSFSIFDDGRRWKDQATGGGGGAVEFIVQAEGRERRDATRRFLELAGMPVVPAQPAPQVAGNTPDHPDVSALHRPTDDEIRTIADGRRLNPDAVGAIAYLGILCTGNVDGHHVWALVDGPLGEPPRIAEIRRMDSKRIPTRDIPEGVKSKTLRGSKKDWPIGASLLASGNWRAVLLCEGMPDMLAAVHFSYEAGQFDLCPVAILGRSNQTLHPEAVALLSGRRIRIFPHADEDDGGVAAAERWASILPGADVDKFDFTGLHRRDGKPVNDLNDCAVIHPDHRHELTELLPPVRRTD